MAGWGDPDWKGVRYPHRPATAAVAQQWAERVRDMPRFRDTAMLWRRSDAFPAALESCANPEVPPSG